MTSSSEVVADRLNLFTVFGFPSYIHSDRGTAFISGKLTSFLSVRGIATSYSSSYHQARN